MAVAAVEMACRELGSLDGRKALIVGGGRMAVQMAQYARKHGFEEMVIANRTTEKVHALARSLGATPAPLETLIDRACDVDALLVCIEYDGGRLLNAGELGQLMSRRGGRPLVVVDISVPRVVEAVGSEVENLRVFDADDLAGVLSDNRGRREQAVTEVEEINARALDRQHNWYNQPAFISDGIRRPIQALMDGGAR